MMRRPGQDAGIVLFFCGGVLIGNGHEDMLRRIISGHHTGDSGPCKRIMKALDRRECHAEGGGAGIE